MKIYIFSQYDFDQIIKMNSDYISRILDRVANNTITDDLVVSIYFSKNGTWIGGSAYVRKWLIPSEFTTNRGRWEVSTKFHQPQNLPPKYKLIRLLFDLNLLKYPLIQKDGYGWQYRYASFNDHLALLFAHELHHFRRFHLGLHPGEGEQSANEWALGHVTDLGFNVVGAKITTNKKRAKFRKSIYRFFDAFKEFRHLAVGTKLLIRYDPKGKYEGEIVPILRPIRSNSRRIVIQTSDGKIWRWPMEWLTILT